MSVPDFKIDVRPHTLVRDLPWVTARQAELLLRLRVQSVGDLLRHLPVRYERQWAEAAITDLPMEVVGSTRGTIVATRLVSSTYRTGRRGRGRDRFEATLEDHSARLTLTWFNGRYLREKMRPGMMIRVQGKTRAYRSHPQMVNPTWEILDPNEAVAAHTDRLRPIYPATEDLPSRQIEKLVTAVLPKVLASIQDPLPRFLIHDHALPPLAEAFRMAHQPAAKQEYLTARRRLAFNELLLLQLGIAIKRHYNQTTLVAPALKWSPAIDQHLRQRFPFELTDAQEQVVRELTGDLQKSQPMNRLLQGDVGAGKTVVGLYALLLAVANGKQAALMAPTELLADQHFLSISNMLAGSSVNISLLTGGQSSAGSLPRRLLLSKIASGQVDIVIGTQALLAQAVKFRDLAVVVIDEQHRFGVMQRAAFRSQPETIEQENNHTRSDCQAPLANQGLHLNAVTTSDEPQPRLNEPANATGDDDLQTRLPLDGEQAARPVGHRSPHCLVMTATPIPRTLSLTVFGDLDVSTINGLPPGRTPITTRVVDQEKADAVYHYMAKRINQGEQAYVVVPAIDPVESQDSPSRVETAHQLKNIREHVRLLANDYFQGHRVAAIHGRLKRSTRESMMDRFRKGEIRVLVATTVIEVGVDVPNATLMVIEHADRFGLAQLHQLRGRIGRGSDGRASLCVFIADPTHEEATARMQAIASTNDGFKIAEHDLAIRGMGDFFGTRQHGLPPLRVADLPRDMDLLRLARHDAHALVAADPQLNDPDHHLLKTVLLQKHGHALGLIDVG